MLELVNRLNSKNDSVNKSENNGRSNSPDK